MNKIFILKGNGDTGKTTKINQIAQWIIDEHGAKDTLDLEPDNLEADTHGVLQVGNLSIGIHSTGDDGEEVRGISKLKTEDGEAPDIIICACRTKGSSYTYINEFAKPKQWLKYFIEVEDCSATALVKQEKRDKRILDELKCWLTGLEK